MPSSNVNVALMDNYQPYFSFLNGFEPEANITGSSLLDGGSSGWYERLSYGDGSSVVINFSGTQNQFSVTADSSGQDVVLNSSVPVHIYVLGPGAKLPPAFPQVLVDLGSWPSWNGSLYASNFLSQWLIGDNTIGPLGLLGSGPPWVTGDQTIMGYGGDDNLWGSLGNDRIIAGGGIEDMYGGPSDPPQLDGNPTGDDTFEFPAYTAVPPSATRTMTVSGTDDSFDAPRLGQFNEVNTIQADGNNDFAFVNIYWINNIVYAGATSLIFGAGNFSSNNHITLYASVEGDANANSLTVEMAPPSGQNVSGDLNMSGLRFFNWTAGQDSVTILDAPSHSGISNIVAPGVFTNVLLGAGSANVHGGLGGSYIVGNGGDDTLVGADGGSNTIYAFGGNDYLQGGNGSPSDVLVATGAGNDTFYGGSGNNYIVGGTGKNTIVGGGGALQTLYSYGSRGDYIVGGLSAGASNVLVESGTGAASLWGGLAGNNYEVGGAGDDLVVGGNNSDYLFGGSGNDTLYGGNGTDYIYPGPGNDFIWTDNIGSQSTDYIYEGVGTGVDTVADFTPGNGVNHDVLVLTAASSAITSFADVQAKAFQAGVYTVLPLSNTDQIYLYNVQPFQLTANDFIFT